MLPRTAIPKGVRVFTPAETAQRRTVERALLSVFQRWGFRTTRSSSWSIGRRDASSRCAWI
jgi:ATP phosphoribosyltransferase regulatory subunit HisZ